MLAKDEANEIIQALATLPPEKVSEVRDYVLFLKHRYGKDRAIDRSSAWTEEDIHDFSVAVWQHAEEAVPWIEPPKEEGEGNTGEEKPRRRLDL